MKLFLNQKINNESIILFSAYNFAIFTTYNSLDKY